MMSLSCRKKQEGEGVPSASYMLDAACLFSTNYIGAASRHMTLTGIIDNHPPCEIILAFSFVSKELLDKLILN